MKKMKETALDLLNIIENSGYKAYIVGGFVRDYLMDIKSSDIDITTNATPKDLTNLFKKLEFSKNINDENSYGAVSIFYKNILFEVTTFRKELAYFDNRHPSKIIYVDDLETDLKRRDFTINTICMNKEGQIIDLLNGKSDLNKKLIKTINNPFISFQDDALRILRAIRFATTLNFKLDEEIIKAIQVCKKYLKNISYERKKRELDKIFVSLNAEFGIKLLQELNLSEVLELPNLEKIKDYSDLIGIWSIINPKHYNFTKNEKELIKKVNLALELDNLNPLVLYKYGLYVNTLAGVNKGYTKKDIVEAFHNLPIKSRSDINIKPEEICKLLNVQPSSLLKTILNKLEIEILNGNLQNSSSFLEEYILNNFKNYEKYVIMK